VRRAAGGSDNVDVYWQYGLSAGNYTQTTPVQPIGSGTFPMTANYEIATSLMAPSVYHYQLVISSTYGVDYGPDQTFSLAIPTVTYTGASTSGTALSLAVDPNGVDTTVSIQYGLTQAYTGGSIALGDIGSGTVPVNVDPTIPGLAPNTEYHYRVVTTTALGTFYGSDETYFQEKFGTAAVLGVEEPALHYRGDLQPAGKSGDKRPGSHGVPGKREWGEGKRRDREQQLRNLGGHWGEWIDADRANWIGGAGLHRAIDRGNI